MKSFIVFNSEGEILRTGSCPDNMVVAQASGEDEWVMEGVADDATQRIDGLNIVDKTQQQIDDKLYAERQDSAPTMNSTMSDAELDAAINDYFVGRVNVAQWRIDNYKLLRRIFYPTTGEMADAQVKIAMGGSLGLEGQSQFDAYTAACYAVKLRFPKL